MRSRLGRSLLSFALLAACSGEETHPDPPPAQRPIDASTVGEFAALAGSWSGSVLLETLGTASGVVRMDAAGAGTYFVTVAGAKQTGTVQLLSFLGTTIRARAAGLERSLPVSLDGNTLRLEVPGLGEVVLQRSPAGR